MSSISCDRYWRLLFHFLGIIFSGNIHGYNIFIWTSHVTTDYYMVQSVDILWSLDDGLLLLTSEIIENTPLVRVIDVLLGKVLINICLIIYTWHAGWILNNLSYILINLLGIWLYLEAYLRRLQILITFLTHDNLRSASVRISHLWWLKLKLGTFSVLLCNFKGVAIIDLLRLLLLLHILDLKL